MRHTLLVIALALAPALAGAQPPAHLREAIGRIDAMAAAELAKDRIAGVTVGVVADGQLAWTASYGLADQEKRTPAARDTVYRIGSITKQFTALMLLQLVQRGTVHLSDPVERYLPEVHALHGRPPGTPPITLVQLATMTSGLGREPANLSTFLAGPVSQWEKVLLSALPATRFDHEPDTRYQYSNIGYAVLGAALARAAGVPYTEYVHEHELVPLGMTRTAFEAGSGQQATLAAGYQVDKSGTVDGETPRREHEGRGYKVPNGAMYTTIDDLARFVAFEVGAGPDTVLPTEVLEENYARANSADGDLTSGYGIGFMLERKGSHVFAGHSGSVAGYSAQAWIHRPSKTGVIVLRNATGGAFDISGLAFRALAELAGAASH
jgi:CubicO group peptidase (beta-lactamase class C family)